MKTKQEKWQVNMTAVVMFLLTAISAHYIYLVFPGLGTVGIMLLGIGLMFFYGWAVLAIADKMVKNFDNKDG